MGEELSNGFPIDLDKIYIRTYKISIKNQYGGVQDLQNYPNKKYTLASVDWVQSYIKNNAILIQNDADKYEWKDIKICINGINYQQINKLYTINLNGDNLPISLDSSTSIKSYIDNNIPSVPIKQIYTNINGTSTKLVPNNGVVTITLNVPTTDLNGYIKVGTSINTDPYNIYVSKSNQSNKADQLTNTRTIKLTGEITGSGTFDGSGDVTITTSKSTESTAGITIQDVQNWWTTKKSSYENKIQSISNNTETLNIDNNKNVDIGGTISGIVQKYINDSVNIPVGMIICMASNLDNEDLYMLCDGRSVPKTDYAELHNAIGVTYGTEETGYFNIPDLRGRFIQGTGSFENKTIDLGTYFDAGLPNISGSFSCDKQTQTDGVFKIDTNVDKQTSIGASSNSDNSKVRFNASNDNSIYGNSDTVQPPALALNFYIRWRSVIDTSNKDEQGT